MKPQTEQIRAALEAGEVLTALIGLERFGTLRLAARIEELRRAGDPIDTELVRTPSGKTIASYAWRVPFQG